MAKPHIEIYDSEWIILEKVWELEPCPAPTVHEALEGQKDWAYSTVKTVMDRMVRKGMLTSDKIRNLSIYHSAITPPQAKKNEIMRAVRRAFNDSLTPMMHFLLENEELTKEEYGELQRIIRNRKRTSKKAK